MPRPTNEVKHLQTTISMLRSQIKQEEIIAAKHRADLEHTKLAIDRLLKENSWQRLVIQSLLEIMQRSIIKER